MVAKKFKYAEGTKMPKKPSSSYTCYVEENLQQIMEKKDINRVQAKEICEKVWEKLSTKQQAKYEKMHQAAEATYKKQLIELQNHGYFTLADGTKSSD
jgi:hypothetical protein